MTADTANIAAATAEKLKTARTISGVTFDGSANISPVGPKTVGPQWFTSGYQSGQYYLCSSIAANSNSASLGFGTLRASPWVVTQDVTIVRLFSEVTATGDAAAVFRFGVYADDGTGKPGAVVVDSVSAALTATGSFEVTVSQALSAGLYWVGGAVQGSGTQPGLRTINGTNMPFVPALGTSLPAANVSAAGFQVTGATGALPGPFGTPTTTGTIPRIGFKTA